MSSMVNSHVRRNRCRQHLQRNARRRCQEETGKTMEQLTAEKRKQLDEKIAKDGYENIKYAKPGRSDIWP